MIWGPGSKECFVLFHESHVAGLQAHNASRRVVSERQCQPGSAGGALSSPSENIVCVVCSFLMRFADLQAHNASHRVVSERHPVAIMSDFIQWQIMFSAYPLKCSRKGFRKMGVPDDHPVAIISGLKRSSGFRL